MKRRTYMGLVGAGMIPIAGCTGDTDEENGDADDEEEEPASDDEGEDDGESVEEVEEEEESEEDSDEESVDAGESHSFQGSGSEVSDEFELDSGIATVEFSHDGESNFITTMVALEGEDWDDELLVNVIGSVEGRSVLSISGGAYQLDIDADGDWSVEIDQPAVSEGDAETPPVEQTGEGPDYFGPVALAGVHEVSASHDGESNFILQAHGIGGDWDLVVNEIGEFEGSSTLRSDDLVYFDVEADGSWSVEIE